MFIQYIFQVTIGRQSTDLYCIILLLMYKPEWVPCCCASVYYMLLCIWVDSSVPSGCELKDLADHL